MKARKRVRNTVFSPSVISLLILTLRKLLKFMRVKIRSIYTKRRCGLTNKDCGTQGRSAVNATNKGLIGSWCFA